VLGGVGAGGGSTGDHETMGGECGHAQGWQRRGGADLGASIGGARRHFDFRGANNTYIYT
jgi:hypothetical protein